MGYSGRQQTELRMLAFVDAGYLIGLRRQVAERPENERFRIHGERLHGWLAALAHRHRFMRTYVYDGRWPETDERRAQQDKEFDELAEWPGVVLRLGTVLPRKNRKNGPEQKGVDTLLVLDMLQMAQQDAYDVAILVAGDADFAELVDAVQRLGREVWVPALASGEGLSKALRQAADVMPVIEPTQVLRVVPKWDDAVFNDPTVSQ